MLRIPRVTDEPPPSACLALLPSRQPCTDAPELRSLLGVTMRKVTHSKSCSRLVQKTPAWATFRARGQEGEVEEPRPAPVHSLFTWGWAAL